MRSIRHSSNLLLSALLLFTGITVFDVEAQTPRGICQEKTAVATLAGIVSDSHDPEATLKKLLSLLSKKQDPLADQIATEIQALLSVMTSQLEVALATATPEPLVSPENASKRKKKDVPSSMNQICEDVVSKLLVFLKKREAPDSFAKILAIYGDSPAPEVPDTGKDLQSSTATEQPTVASGTDSPSSSLPIVLGPTGISSNHIPVISWQDQSNSSQYEIWISRFESPRTAILQQKVSGSSFRYPTPLPFGRYSVWIRTISDKGAAGKWSVPSHFSIFPDTPSMVAPAFETSDPTPDFRWNSIAGAQTYEIWVSEEKTPLVALIRQVVGELSYSDQTQLIPGRYSVWVRAIAGTYMSAWSAVRKFTIVPTESVCPGAAPGAPFPLGSCLKNDGNYSSTAGGCRHQRSGVVVSEPLNALTEQSRMKWSDAAAACQALTQGGFCDWRLPDSEDFRKITIQSDPRSYLKQNYPYSWTSERSLQGPLANDPVGEDVYKAFSWPNISTIGLFTASTKLGIHCVRDDNGIASPLNTPTPTPTATATSTSTPVPTATPTATPTASSGTECNQGSAPANCKISDAQFRTQNGGCQQNETGLVFSKPGHTTDVRSYITWDQADAYCQNLNEGCRTDWRLPKLAEYVQAASKSTLSSYVPNTGAMVWTTTQASASTHRAFWWASNSPQGGNFPDSTKLGVHCIRGESDAVDMPQCVPLKLQCASDQQCCSGRCADGECSYPDPNTVRLNREGGFCIDNDDCENPLYCNSNGYYCQSKSSVTAGWKNLRVIDMNYQDGLREIGSYHDMLVLYGGGHAISNNPTRYNNISIETSRDGSSWQSGGTFPAGVGVASLLEFQGKARFCGIAADGANDLCYSARAEDLSAGFSTITYNLRDIRPAMISFRVAGIEQLLRIGNTDLPGPGDVATRSVWASPYGDEFTPLKNSAGSEDILPFNAESSTVVKVIDPKTFRETLLTIRSYAGVTQVATSTNGSDWTLASTFDGWAYTINPGIFVLNNKVIIEGSIPDLSRKDSLGRYILIPKLFVSSDAGKTWAIKPGLPEVPNWIHRSPVPAYVNEHLFRVFRTSDAAGSGSVLYSFPASPLLTPRKSVPPIATPTPGSEVCPTFPPNQPLPGACNRQDSVFKNQEGGCYDSQDRLAVSKLILNNTWQRAQSSCADLKEGGYCDWRLPSQSELQTILAQSRVNGGTHILSSMNTIWTTDRNTSNSIWTIQWNNGQAVSMYEGSTAIGTFCVRGQGPNSTPSAYSCGAADTQRSQPPAGPCLVEDLRHKTKHGGCSIDEIRAWSKQHPDDYSRALKRQEAIQYCANSYESGYCNWRVPTIDELAALANDAPAKYLQLSTSRPFWTHPDDGSRYNSYDLQAKKGTLYSADSSNYTICIRDVTTTEAPGACIQYDSTNKFSSSHGGCYDSQARLAWSASSYLAKDWFAAQDYCSTLREGGLSGWHLPGYEDFSALGGANAIKYIGLISDKFWTTSTVPGASSSRYYYDISGREFWKSSKTNNYLNVVCVRSE